VPDSNLPPQHIRIDIIRKEQAKNTQRYKVEYDSQSTDTLNFSSESKQETEYVSKFHKWKGVFLLLNVYLYGCICMLFQQNKQEKSKNGYIYCTYLKLSILPIQLFGLQMQTSS